MLHPLYCETGIGVLHHLSNSLWEWSFSTILDVVEAMICIDDVLCFHQTYNFNFSRNVMITVVRLVA